MCVGCWERKETRDERRNGPLQGSRPSLFFVGLCVCMCVLIFTVKPLSACFHMLADHQPDTTTRCRHAARTPHTRYTHATQSSSFIITVIITPDGAADRTIRGIRRAVTTAKRGTEEAPLQSRGQALIVPSRAHTTDTPWRA